jgi:carboxypeptidase Q
MQCCQSETGKHASTPGVTVVQSQNKVQTLIEKGHSMKTLRSLVVIVLFLLPLMLYSQKEQPRVDWDAVAKIREEGLQRSQVTDIVGYITDVLGSRLSLSQQMKKAQVWAKGEMGKIGLTNVVVEPFMDYGAAWDNEYFSIQMLEPTYVPMMGFPLAYTPGTQGKVVCPAVLVDIQTKSDYDKYRGKLKNAAALVSPALAIDLTNLPKDVSRLTDEELKSLEGMAVQPPRVFTPPVPNPELVKPEERIEFLKSEGVAVILQCDGGTFGLVRGFSRPGSNGDKWSREKDLNSLPMAAVTPEYYNRMVRILKRDIPVKIEVEIRNRIGETVEKACNVIGEIPGTDLKNEIVMIGAHLDSWHESPGATDNAAGCAVALEAARILKAIGVHPRRTIRVALWSGEEQGLNGSREYVLAHFGDPKKGTKAEYEKFSVYFNQDYGAGAYRGINLQGNEFVRRIFGAWMEPFRDLGMTMMTIQSVGSTDHIPFDNAGLPGFQFLQDRVGIGGHSNMDVFDTLVQEDLKKNAVIMAAFAYHAAMSDQRIPRKPMN